ncbi:retrieval of early ER protein Rer1 [Metschnikowia bicuspidata var. bicuspidata NRRL YB-4993]|uniref:Protein RER1 n=1 Tax=Metschnikowia bicuspidata var. bicuspidata NRRL YB-4993 TaxID=869754 RepID=A0A1A0HDQ4_9ASCO|nr:retrieval of early ER protein Rer1 [Metschnikowia bicuspidata var. bicuspidata NRRL YB-4993]OBA22214.1 retrieval of early ER protein Rer1 [Metschnikowia bicuspidata var. bicuspidata NRRL YB-4993]
MFDFTNNPIITNFLRLRLTCQKLVDQSVPYTARRWTAFTFLLLVFVGRILFAQGWYIICYTLAIYLLNLFLQFLTPKFDPSLEQELKSSTLEEGGDDKVDLDEEFRPFIRRLPEFKLWLHGTTATAILLIVSFIPIFDIPVFWPILLMYFIVLFTLTMRKQIQHMMKYKYLPFDIGKTKYGH